MWKARLSELEFNDRELAEVLETIDSEWITSGPRTDAFEKAFSSLAGTNEAVAVSNGGVLHQIARRDAGVICGHAGSPGKLVADSGHLQRRAWKTACVDA